MNAYQLVQVAAALSLVACTAPVGSSSTEAASASTLAAHWSCVGAPPATQPPTTVEQQGTPGTPFDVSLVEAFTHAPVGGLELAVCARSDADCGAPLSQGQADAMGLATLSAPGDPASFEGFVRVSGPDIATHYVFLPHRVPAWGTSALSVELYTPAALRTAARTSALSIDTQQAIVRVDAHDCADAPAAGVAVSIGAFAAGQPVTAYSVADGQSLSRRTTATDGSGIAVGFGLAEGDIGIADRLEGKLVGGAIAFTRAGAVSEIVVRP
jgi:hypothetical protein